jgi:hypothetical protein
MLFAGNERIPVKRGAYVFPYLGVEIIEWLIAWCARDENRSRRPSPPAQSAHQSTPAPVTTTDQTKPHAARESVNPFLEYDFVFETDQVELAYPGLRDVRHSLAPAAGGYLPVFPDS